MGKTSFIRIQDDVDLSAAANATATTPNTELSALEEASERWAEEFWRRALRRLRETLSHEDTVGWLRACGVHVQRVRRGSLFMLMNDENSPSGSLFMLMNDENSPSGMYIQPTRLLSEDVQSISFSLRLNSPLPDEDEEEHEYVDQGAERNRIGEEGSDDEAGGDVEEAEETEQEADQDNAQGEAKYDSDEDSNDDEALAQVQARRRGRARRQTKTPKQIMVAAAGAHPYASIA
ncbi:hypothetical protein MY10362_006172 [Beauveria mimosiformis]